MAAEGLITFDELRTRLVDLEEISKAADGELSPLRNRAER
jgi:hypothetical protein